MSISSSESVFRMGSIEWFNAKGLFSDMISFSCYVFKNDLLLKMYHAQDGSTSNYLEKKNKKMIVCARFLANQTIVFSSF